MSTHQRRKETKDEDLDDEKCNYAERFDGRDRRLYINKALCELKLGQGKAAVSTCMAFLKPVKRAFKKLIEAEDKEKRAIQRDAQLKGPSKVIKQPSDLINLNPTKELSKISE